MDRVTAAVANEMTLVEPHHEKTKTVVPEQVRHKPNCTVTEDGKRLEILDLEN